WHARRRLGSAGARSRASGYRAVEPWDFISPSIRAPSSSVSKTSHSLAVISVDAVTTLAPSAFRQSGRPDGRTVPWRVSSGRLPLQSLRRRGGNHQQKPEGRGQSE